MLRIRLAMTLLAALALVGAACGGGDVDTTSDQQPEAEATVTTQAGSDDAPEEVSDAAAVEDDVEAAAADAMGDAGSSDDGPDAPPVDAEALLASATTVLDGRSVRGEARMELAPGFAALSSSFESDADGDLAVAVEVPPGFDPEFPGGADGEVRYVGDVIYVRPAVGDETLAELGVEEPWFVAGSVEGVDPMGDLMLQSAGGVLCVFPQSLMAPLGECDPLGDAGALLEAAGQAEIVGREEVRGAEATRVRFQVSLLDLSGEALFSADEGGVAAADASDGGFSDDSAEDPDGAFFDDGTEDPFAEGLEQFFGFLDASFEVEVWLDDESLIRRLSFDLASLFAGLVGPDDDVEGPSSLITVEFYDFDADISVEAPPPEAIVDEDLLIGGDDYATTEEYEPYDDDYS